ncbi:hypothetical protein GCM10010917_18370 [Paenibacillus physcomitrellae]|uniref:Uncharacterized protein n=1 Tax=Paenibacillus physcomitrellae TaxID=1619311 RepID=A0ABQ1FZ96_9BACL|nr:hypothetical protein GCM10010917_18370 [Paenibacillus physcomitrellae]
MLEDHIIRNLAEVEPSTRAAFARYAKSQDLCYDRTCNYKKVCIYLFVSIEEGVTHHLIGFIYILLKTRVNKEV